MQMEFIELTQECNHKNYTFAFIYSAKKKSGKSLFLLIPSYEIGSQVCFSTNPFFAATFK